MSLVVVHWFKSQVSVCLVNHNLTVVLPYHTLMILEALLAGVPVRIAHDNLVPGERSEKVFDKDPNEEN